MVRAIANLMAITIEKARALEDASHAEAARQSEVLKSALLDSLAHDIKTPLTSIKAAVTSLLSDAAAPSHELLTIINEDADRLNQLAAEVIAMARIEAGKLHLEKQPVAAGGADLERAGGHGAGASGPRRDHRGRARTARGRSRSRIRAAGGQAVSGKRAEVFAGAAPIAVSAGLKGGKIVIGVADRGPGIEENERALIFDKFFRGRQHRFESKGTGMGLAIAKGIVEAHGERIWVESEPGQGSAFYFTLAVYGGRQI